MKLAVLTLLASICALSPGAQAAARFAVVAGNNRGAAGRAQLWYAESDAERFAHALEELGEFTPERVAVLHGASLGELRAALAIAEVGIARARAQGERALLVVYFSGHAASAGLELGDERLSYEELRGALAASSAETKVGIVDACEAGELTQVKGARADPAVLFTVPSEETAQGTALIASTAVGEAAQESASIGGSFFTHHLEIGLRGAADADGDGKVTLAEAFRYTAARTVAGTATTRAGPQHPTYDFKMSGRGDVVLADLRRGEGTLRLPPDADASYVVRGPHELFAEVPASPEGMTLALPAGSYSVERRGEGGLASATVTLERGETRTLPRLRPGGYQLARAKGGAAPLLFFAGGGVAFHPMPGLGPAPMLRVGVRREVSSLGLRLRLDVLRRDAAQGPLAYGFQVFSGGLALLWPVPAGPVLIEAGPELAAGVAIQTVPGAASHTVGDLAGGFAALASVRTGPLRLGVDAGVLLHTFRLDGAQVARPGASLSLVALYGF